MSPLGTEFLLPQAHQMNDLASKIQAALKQPEVIKKLESLGAVPVGNSPKEFAKYINLELKKWELVIKPLNVSLD